jgi:phosphoglycerate dehydrogenase-like enzyme
MANILRIILSEKFSSSKQSCVLLNASRGSVIDFEALAQHGAHLRWCFDVWEHEPR